MASLYNLKVPYRWRQFLDERNVNTKFVAVAYNGNVLQKEEYNGIVLNEGDVLEIVQPVGGG